MKRITVIGSESFLARNFIKYSSNVGLSYQFELYDYGNISKNCNLKFKKIDFSDKDDIKNIDFSADAIMIFIGKTGTVAGFDEYKAFIEVNEIMLLNILSEYVKAESKARIIYPSSRLLFKSNNNETIKEDGEREYKSIYAVTKLAAEEYLKIYNDVFDVKSVILRICTPIGTLLDDFGNYGTFEIFKHQAIEKGEITIFGNGLQRKTFTSMIDICKAFSLLIDKEILDHREYNLGGQALSLLDIAQKIANEYGVKIKHMLWPDIYHKVDGGSVVFDSSRFDREFDMKYKMVL